MAQGQQRSQRRAPRLLLTLKPARVVRVRTSHRGPPRGRGSQGAREGMASEAVPAPSPAWGECLGPLAACPLPCRQPRVKGGWFGHL